MAQLVSPHRYCQTPLHGVQGGTQAGIFTGGGPAVGPELAYGGGQACSSPGKFGQQGPVLALCGLEMCEHPLFVVDHGFGIPGGDHRLGCALSFGP